VIFIHLKFEYLIDIKMIKLD